MDAVFCSGAAAWRLQSISAPVKQRSTRKKKAELQLRSAPFTSQEQIIGLSAHDDGDAGEDRQAPGDLAHRELLVEENNVAQDHEKERDAGDKSRHGGGRGRQSRHFEGEVVDADKRESGEDRERHGQPEFPVEEDSQHPLRREHAAGKQ